MFTVACNDTNTPKPEPQVTFDLSSPTENFMCAKLDTLHIMGSISCDDNMHGYEIVVSPLADEENVVLFKENKDHATMYHVHEQWINIMNQHTDMRLTIKVYTDHDGSFVEKRVLFMAHGM